MTGSDAERELLNRRQKKAMRQANKAVQAREEDPSYFDKEPVPEPKKDMYFELIYAEKMCQNYRATLANSTQLSIGDTQSFDCELYEKAIRFGTHGGEKVGNTFWTCRISGFFDIVIEFIEFTDNAVWDCTINDYIGGDGDDDIDDTDTYIRNEGIAIGVGPFGPADRTGVYWNEHFKLVYRRVDVDAMMPLNLDSNML
eukprot:15367168-Ditylum_brightwellii.AAC.1